MVWGLGERFNLSRRGVRPTGDSRFSFVLPPLLQLRLNSNLLYLNYARFFSLTELPVTRDPNKGTCVMTIITIIVSRIEGEYYYYLNKANFDLVFRLVGYLVTN